MKEELKQLVANSRNGLLAHEKERLTALFKAAAMKGETSCIVAVNERLNVEFYRTIFPDLTFGEFKKHFGYDARESNGTTCQVSWE